METFKILKYHCPISLYELFTLDPKSKKYLLIPPRVTLETTKKNFIFKSSQIWNNIIGVVLDLNKCVPSDDGVVIPGSYENSDMSASICVIKNKLKEHLLLSQMQGDINNWY